MANPIVKYVDFNSALFPSDDVRSTGNIGIAMLLNVRPCPTQRGVLEQCPRFYNVFTLGQGTYDGGTDGATSRVTFIDRDPNASNENARIAFTQNCIWSYNATAWAQAQSYIQSAVPTNSTITGRCLMIPQVANLGVNLSATIDVEIDGATTFKWRYNGGAYTSGVTIANEVTITLSGGAAKLYFLTTAGFSVGEIWSWKRTDKSYCNRTPGYLWHNKKLYFSAPYSGDPPAVYQVFIYDPAITTAYSLGYRPVYGKHISIDSGHLFVSEFSETAVASNGTDYLACSDLNNFHNFFPTDVNEADTFSLGSTDSRFSHVFYILGFSKRGGIFSVITTEGIFTASYLGLPVPYKFVVTYPFSPLLKRYHVYGVNRYIVEGTEVDYILGNDAVYSYNGSQPVRTNCTFPFFTSLPHNFTNQVAYNRINGELLIMVESYETASPTYYTICFQERTNQVYFRKFPAGDDTFLTLIDNDIFLGLNSLKLATEDREFTQTPMFDLTASTYATPRITTGLVTNSLVNVCDFGPSFVGAYVKDNGVGFSTPGAAYDSATNVGVKVSWALIDDGYLGFVRWPGIETTRTYTTDVNAKWIEGKLPEISYPRTYGCDISLAFDLVGTTKPPCQIYITGLGLKVRDGGAES